MSLSVRTLRFSWIPSVFMVGLLLLWTGCQDVPTAPETSPADVTNAPDANVDTEPKTTPPVYTTASLDRPVLSFSANGNQSLQISWQAISGATSYEIEIIECPHNSGTLQEGNVGNVTSVTDYPYEEPDFNYFEEAQGDIYDTCLFRAYRVTAIGPSGESDPSLWLWVRANGCGSFG